MVESVMKTCRNCSRLECEAGDCHCIAGHFDSIFDAENESPDLDTPVLCPDWRRAGSVGSGCSNTVEV